MGTKVNKGVRNLKDILRFLTPLSHLCRGRKEPEPWKTTSAPPARCSGVVRPSHPNARSLPADVPGRVRPSAA
jgi:hypothetical protein